LVEARKQVQEQCDIAQALLQNQQRARNFNDASILPELCTSHRHQIKVRLGILVSRSYIFLLTY
jgi:RB1-inducible coiled-coil protein 1